MPLKKVIFKVRRALLCCSKRDSKTSLDIGSPTDVRRVDISDALPGLTDAERKYLREKASSDAIYLLGIQSHPPSNSATLPPSPTASHSPSLATTSAISSREPSVALLNAASKDLPNALPTPPRHTHHEDSPPTSRMKSMWDSSKRRSTGSKRLNSTPASPEGLYRKLEQLQSSETETKSPAESTRTLNLEFGADDNKAAVDSPRTLSLTEGFEMQDTVGGKQVPAARGLVVKKAIEATDLGDSSESEDGSFAASEQKRLVPKV
ncbi:hypothetical protein ACN47E_009800 [Coniothyrium glycines]